MGRIGVPVDIPEVSESMGIAPGPPVIVLGGRVVVLLIPWDGTGVPGLTPGVLAGLGVVLVVVLVLVGVATEIEGLGTELEGLGFCLSTSWR